MLESLRRFHPKFALAALLGCAVFCQPRGLPAQTVYWPGLVLLTHEEVEAFDYQLGLACTAAVRANRLAELKELFAAGGPEFEAQDEYARGMLFYAAQEGSEEMIGWLLSASGGNL